MKTGLLYNIVKAAADREATRRLNALRCENRAMRALLHVGPHRQICALAECSKMFNPTRSRGGTPRKFCSDTCCWRASAIRKRTGQPTGRPRLTPTNA